MKLASVDDVRKMSLTDMIATLEAFNVAHGFKSVEAELTKHLQALIRLSGVKGDLDTLTWSDIPAKAEAEGYKSRYWIVQQKFIKEGYLAKQQTLAEEQVSTYIDGALRHRVIKAIGHQIRLFLDFLNHPQKPSQFDAVAHKVDLLGRVPDDFMAVAKDYEQNPQDYTDDALVRKGMQNGRSVNYPVRIEVSDPMPDGSVAQIEARGVFEDFRKVTLEKLYDLFGAGLTFMRGGQFTVEANRTGVDKALPIQYIEKHFDEVLDLIGYQAGPKIDSRQSRTILAADGNGTTYPKPANGLVPHLLSSQAYAELIQYLELGGIYLLITGSSMKKTARRLTDPDAIPVHLRSRFLIATNSGANLAYLTKDGKMVEIEEYRLKAMKEKPTYASSGSLDIIYMADNASVDSDDYAAFVYVGHSRSILLGKLLPDVIPFALHAQHVGGQALGLRAVLRHINRMAVQQKTKRLFSSRNVRYIIDAIRSQSTDEGDDATVWRDWQWSNRQELLAEGTLKGLTRSSGKAESVKTLPSGEQVTLTTRVAVAELNRKLNQVRRKLLEKHHFRILPLDDIIIRVKWPMYKSAIFEKKNGQLIINIDIRSFEEAAFLYIILEHELTDLLLEHLLPGLNPALREIFTLLAVNVQRTIQLRDQRNDMALRVLTLLSRHAHMGRGFGWVYKRIYEDRRIRSWEDAVRIIYREVTDAERKVYWKSSWEGVAADFLKTMGIAAGTTRLSSDQRFALIDRLERMDAVLQGSLSASLLRSRSAIDRPVQGDVRRMALTDMIDTLEAYNIVHGSRSVKDVLTKHIRTLLQMSGLEGDLTCLTWKDLPRKAQAKGYWNRYWVVEQKFILDGYIRRIQAGRKEKDQDQGSEQARSLMDKAAVILSEKMARELSRELQKALNARMYIWGDEEHNDQPLKYQPYYSYQDNVYHREDGIVMKQDRREVAFARIGYLFFVDQKYYAQLPQDLKKRLGANVILMQELSQRDLAAQGYSANNTPMIIQLMNTPLKDQDILDVGTGDGF